MTSRELEKYINDYISTFSKICPNCGCRIKENRYEHLLVAILCKECDREDKINKILDEEKS